mmetsp:Transcript_32000/g.55174  ORF Transcript_32000/g.55174 Transcript_32000/m.55174 type:complete len:148 (+) Transcript_32000:430-873(+)
MRNNKSFILFLTYFLIGITQYSHVALDYVFSLHGQEDMMPSWLFKGYFYFHNLIVFSFSFMVLTLFSQHVRFVYKNYTTVEYLDYRKDHGYLGCYDWCCMLPGTNYDLGLVPNFFQVFGRDVFWWFLPTVPDNHRVELGFNKVPEVK